MGLVLEYVSSREYSIIQGLEKLGVKAVSAPAANYDNAEVSAVFISGEFAVRSDENAAIVREVCARFGKLETPVVFDPDLSNSGADKYPLINEIAALSEIFLPSDEDAKELCGLDDPEKTAEHYLSLGVPKIIITLDKKGAYYRRLYSDVPCGQGGRHARRWQGIRGGADKRRYRGDTAKRGGHQSECVRMYLNSEAWRVFPRQRGAARVYARSSLCGGWL